MTIIAVLDSDILFQLPLRDTLLRAAENGIYEPRWSQKILDDTTRNLVNKGRSTELGVVRLQQNLKAYFPEAMVEVPEELIERMTNHPGDRHVAAAAVMANATVIVTFNLRHFPEDSLTPWRIEAVRPDVFLNQLYENSAAALLEIISQQAAALKNPPVSVTELLAKLSSQVPEFVNKIRENF